MEIKGDTNSGGIDAVNVDPDALATAQIRMQQQANMERVPQSGSVSFFTPYDFVLMFHAGALCKGISYIGKVTEKCPEEVLRGRKLALNQEFNEELMPLLDKMIENGGAITLEQRAEMLDHIVDSVYVLLGLAANLGLPFDIGFAVVHDANMKKLFMDGAPIWNEDGKVMKPEGWKPPDMQLFEVMRRAYAMEVKANPQQQNNLPQEVPGAKNDDAAVAAGTAAVNSEGPASVVEDTPAPAVDSAEKPTPQ